MKEKLVRFGVSLEAELLRRFDAYIGAEGCSNRSKAIAGLIRKEFVSDALSGGGTVAGAVTVIYDLGARVAVIKLTGIQRANAGIIISVQRVRLDRGSCMEIMAVKGSGVKLKALADSLAAVKGVKHAALSVTGGPFAPSGGGA